MALGTNAECNSTTPAMCYISLIHEPEELYKHFHLSCQTSGLWVTTTSPIWWRRCSRWWPGTRTVQRSVMGRGHGRGGGTAMRGGVSELTAVCVCRFRRRSLCALWTWRVCSGETEGGRVWSGATPPSLTSPRCCCEPTRPKRPGERGSPSHSRAFNRSLTADAHCQMMWKWNGSHPPHPLSLIVPCREMLQLFKSENRVPK